MEGAVKLWEIADDIQQLSERLVETGGELTPELEAEWDRLDGTFSEKVERTALRIRELEANAEAAKAEETRLSGIRKSLEGEAKGLKSYLLMQMQRVGRDRVETHRARVRVYETPKPSIRWMGSDESIPEEFRKVRVSLDGTLAHEVWKQAGELPPGFEIRTSEFLRIL